MRLLFKITVATLVLTLVMHTALKTETLRLLEGVAILFTESSSQIILVTV